MEPLNDRPIIGILAQGVKNANILKYFSEARGRSYIAASYVKFVESGGGRVIPISDQMIASELDEAMNCINGVLIPGGEANILNSTFANVGELVLKKAKESNDNGIYFPIFSICLGFELLINYVAEEDVRSKIVCEGSKSIQFTNGARQQRLLKNCTEETMQAMVSQNVTYNNQKYGFTPNIFNDKKKLSDFFHILAVTENDDKEFVAIIEAKEYPFYGLQWHPEKCQFEWNVSSDINHSSLAIETGQYFSNFFIREAKKNNNHYENSRKENESTIWNYQPLYTGDISIFEQIYLI